MSENHYPLLISSPTSGIYNVSYKKIVWQDSSFKYSTTVETVGSETPVIKSYVDVEGTEAPYISVTITSATKVIKDFINAQNRNRELLHIECGSKKCTAIMEVSPSIEFTTGNLELKFLITVQQGY